MFNNFEHNNQGVVKVFQVGFNIRTLQVDYSPACSSNLIRLLQDALVNPEVLNNYLLSHNRFGYVSATELSMDAIKRLLKSL